MFIMCLLFVDQMYFLKITKKNENIACNYTIQHLLYKDTVFESYLNLTKLISKRTIRI